MDRVFNMLGMEVDWRLMLTVGSLIFIRLMMITTTIPFLTGKPVPAPIKISLALALMVFLYPYLVPEDPNVLKMSPFLLMLLYLKEAVYGVAIGFASSIVFYGFEAAGAVVDNQRGAAQARLLIPQFGLESSIFGQFEFQLGIVLFLTIGGHIFFFKTVMESYDLLPLLSLPGSRLDLIGLVDEFIKLSGIVLLLSMQLCAPVLISIFVADIILGMISKTAPAINVWEMGFVIRGVLGVVAIFLSLGLIISQMEKISMTAVDHVEKILHFFSAT